MYSRVTKRDVISALKKLRDIPRPYGDNEGDPINSPAVYDGLSPEDQKCVDRAEWVVNEYVRKPGGNGGEPNRRSITELNKAGYPTNLHRDQDGPDHLVGSVQVGEWTLDVSDENDD